ncbi:hypothetical protein BGX31_010388, partial [Mortierella sp. GBA43]
MVDRALSRDPTSFMSTGYQQLSQRGFQYPAALHDLCTHYEGWGPVSPTRYDLTPCFEHSVFGVLSVLAAALFASRIYYLRHHGKAHGLGRTAWIYWPTQACAAVAAIIALFLSICAFLTPSESPIVGLGYVCLGFAWGLSLWLNTYEHKCEIRSSSAIFAFYVFSILSALMIINTTLDLESSDHPMFAPLVALASVLTLGFIVEAWPRGGTRVQKLSGESLYSKANVFSRLTFFFYLPLVKIGFHRSLTQDDLWGQLPKHMTTAVVCKEMPILWNAKVRESKVTGKKPSLLAVILISQWKELIPAILARIAIILFSYSLPVLLKELLSYLEDHQSRPLSYGVGLAIGMFFSSLFASLLNTYNRYQLLLRGVTTRIGLINMIYRKSLRLSPKSRNETTQGEIANHMSVDADQWWDMYVSLSLWITIPIEVGIAMTLLYGVLGWTMLAGVFAMVAMLPLQAWQARMYDRLQSQKLKAMDERVRLTTDILASMKIIKLYAWGKAFSDRILAVRQKELQALKSIGIVQSFMSIVFISSSLVISLITFGVYALWGGPNFTPGKLTPQTVFVSMTLFAMLKSPISSLSDATTSTINALVSTRRIEVFLLREEINDKDIIRFDRLPRDPQEPVISIRHATFSWTGPSYEASYQPPVNERSALLSDQDSSTWLPPALRDINLAIQRGNLTAIVGRVGQGKSSLLSALINDMYKLSGKVQVSGRVAYVPQQAWIVNKTLKDNILFGSEYDEARYKQVLRAAGLEPDLAILPAGDMTEIGERGINLSGGQKQRVSLARAAYANADIYLLDDPLSAVDAHVGRHLWEKLLGPNGMLAHKTRVLVTHGIHHLRDMDQIVVLKNGVIEETGGYSELMLNRGVFYRLIKEYAQQERAQSKLANKTLKNIADADISASACTSGTATPDGLQESEAVDLENKGIEDQDQDSNTEEGTTPPETKDQNMELKGKLITAEVIGEGSVDWDVIVAYMQAVSYSTSAVIVLLFLLAQGCLVSASLWLKHWIAKTKEPSDETPSLLLFLGVYAAITLVYVLIYVVVEWLGLAVARVRAAERIHATLLARIFRLSIAFFDTTPLGRIINRFSSDMSAVDHKISQKLMEILLFGISVCSTFLLVAFTTTAFTVVFPFLVLAYWAALKCFLNISRTLTRIYAATKSPIYQHFNESLGGVSTIRAFNVEGTFIDTSARLTDRGTNNFLCNMSSRRWLDSQLRTLSSIVLLLAALFAVLGRENIDPSMVGLTLSFAMTLTEEMTVVVRNYSDCQNQLVSLERVLEYTKLKTEAPEKTDVVLPPKWPSQGHIRFVNYSTRYREGLDLVIRNVDLDIKPTEKVGI